LLAAAVLCGQAAAQEQAQVMIDRGLTEDLPYTAIYPSVLRSVDDGSAATILTLQHPDVPLQCDVFAVDGAPEGWSAQEALDKLDAAGIEATWTPDFPGFRLVGRSVVNFASGPALLYEGE